MPTANAMLRTFDLEPISPYLTATLLWARRHMLPAGASAATDGTHALALWLVLDGTVRVRFAQDGDTEILMRKGDTVLMATNTRRVIAAPGGAQWMSVGLGLRLFAQDYTLRLFPQLCIWGNDTESPALLALMEAATACCANDQQKSPLYPAAPFPLHAPTTAVGRWAGDGIARSLVAHIARRHHTDSSTDAPGDGVPDVPVRLLAALLRLSQDPATASVESLANVSDVSASQLTRLFRRHMGTTPQQQIQRVRLETAAARLRETGETVATIAASVGMESLSHFSRTFAAYFGCSPARYRKGQRGQL